MTTILATVVVLWVYYPTSKGYQWAPAGTAVSMDDCENDVEPREIAKDDARQGPPLSIGGASAIAAIDIALGARWRTSPAGLAKFGLAPERAAARKL
jgi:hypothetical protein